MKLILIALLICLMALPVFAYDSGVVYTVGSSVTTKLSNTMNYNPIRYDILCVCGPIETNPVRVTWAPLSTPTTTIGHLLGVGQTVTLHKQLLTDIGQPAGGTIMRDEVSNFQAIATGATLTATMPCTCD